MNEASATTTSRPPFTRVQYILILLICSLAAQFFIAVATACFAFLRGMGIEVTIDALIIPTAIILPATGVLPLYGVFLPLYLQHLRGQGYRVIGIQNIMRAIGILFTLGFCVISEYHLTFIPAALFIYTYLGITTWLFILNDGTRNKHAR